jgi:hypothetical protein
MSRISQWGTRWGWKERAPCRLTLVAWWGPSPRSCIISTQSWTPLTRLYLKPTIYRTHWVISWPAADEHRINKTDLKNAKIGGETLPELLPVAPLTPSTPLPSTIWWRGSCSPHGLRGCGSNLYQTLSLVLHRLDSYELSIMIVTIAVLPVWWILCLRDDLWDAKIYVLDVWVDVCVTPFCFACSNQINMLGHVWGCVH